ncbi:MULTISPECIES: hypothetical protein [unclassified Streptomyces]
MNNQVFGAHAVVTYGVGGDPRFDLTEQWVREDGAWHYDRCEPLDDY